ncbi:putative Amino acid transporter protein [Mesorhizobium plurifarium]|uniref:Putative Amino acid transporter protein n=1 Tax=Mesorhizobium plurifarium TaxID=69974 RepID=A0A090FT81_MESPL|nr:putative Amino acid transporter protein [Mesorhizobium plurifarium]
MTESKLVHNERVKLAATFFNSLAVIALATGAILPTVTLSMAGKPLEVSTFLPLIFGAFISAFCVSIARSLLGHLKD